MWMPPGRVSAREAKLLARSGRIDELRSLAQSGDPRAARWLATALARTGRTDELRDRMAGGDRHARWALADSLVRQRRMEEAIAEMRPLAAAGIPGADHRLARLLGGQGRYREALTALREAPPNWRDTARVRGWLGARGLMDRARWQPSQRYVDELRRAALAGSAEAKVQLSWIVLMRWHDDDKPATVELLHAVGPDDWLHRRLVDVSRGAWQRPLRAAYIELLATGPAAYRQTRAALLLLQARPDDG
jgi:hypothetical protein